MRRLALALLALASAPGLSVSRSPLCLLPRHDRPGPQAQPAKPRAHYYGALRGRYACVRQRGAGAAFPRRRSYVAAVHLHGKAGPAPGVCRAAPQTEAECREKVNGYKG